MTAACRPEGDPFGHKTLMPNARDDGMPILIYVVWGYTIPMHRWTDIRVDPLENSQRGTGEGRELVRRYNRLRQI